MTDTPGSLPLFGPCPMFAQGMRPHDFKKFVVQIASCVDPAGAPVSCSPVRFACQARELISVADDESMSVILTANSLQLELNHTEGLLLFQRTVISCHYAG